ncbi:MAG TPA: pilus assembly protein TadG-related protein [Pyrinomonadaceae bacterium]|jgi:Flp pilus assembly protein TadG|nr:pilus assembly protein TadG-related protein [Pyrinomonadaceae bacterium]
MKGSEKKIRRGERGSVMALSAVAMLSILLAAGLGIDISRFYLAKNELQNAADAAALAAASALNSSPSGITNARDRAMQEMNKYNFNNGNVSIAEAAIRFSVNLNGTYVNFTDAYNSPANIRFVEVTTPQLAIPVSFAAMVLGTSKNLSATATAGLSVPLNSFCNFIPLSVIDYDVPMVPGQTYTIRADTGGSPSPGNYQILAVAGPGGVDVGFGIGAGVDACASPGETYYVDTKPGLTAGKVRTGLNARFDDYGGSQLDPTLEPPDTNIKEGITHDQYLASRDPLNTNYQSSSIYQAASHPGVDDRRIVLIPIVKLSEYDAGRGTVTFDHFGAFFLKTKAGGGGGGDIQAEYIDNRFAVGKGHYIPGGAVGNPLLATPVLYK